MSSCSAELLRVGRIDEATHAYVSAREHAQL
jgi:hypothetical protein